MLKQVPKGVQSTSTDADGVCLAIAKDATIHPVLQKQHQKNEVSVLAVLGEKNNPATRRCCQKLARTTSLVLGGLATWELPFDRSLEFDENQSNIRLWRAAVPCRFAPPARGSFSGTASPGGDRHMRKRNFYATANHKPKNPHADPLESRQNPAKYSHIRAFPDISPYRPKL